MRRRRYWTVVATKQASSTDAREHVARQGFEILHLMYRSRPERGVRRVLPLFPYYLLVRIKRGDDWRSLSSTRGVRQLFTSGDAPSVVPDECVSYFRSLENELGYCAVPEHEAPRFAEAEPVRGVSGLFTDCAGIYQGLVGAAHERVRVLFTILGVPKVCEVSAFDLVSNL